MRKNNHHFSIFAGLFFAFLSVVIIQITWKVLGKWSFLLATVCAVICGFPILAHCGKERMIKACEIYRGSGADAKRFDRAMYLGCAEVCAFQWLVLPVSIAAGGMLWRYIAFPAAIYDIGVCAFNYDFYYSLGWGKKYVILQFSAHVLLLLAGITVRLL